MGHKYARRSAWFPRRSCRYPITVITAAACVSVALSFFLGTFIRLESSHQVPLSIHPSSDSLKYILFYNKYWERSDYGFGFGQQPFLDYKCPIHNCFATVPPPLRGEGPRNKTVDIDSLTSFSKYDAVIFHCLNGEMCNLEEVRNFRRPHQRFVYFMEESPMYETFPHDKYPSFFNWTMTYRLDSDIPRPYGWFEPRKATRLSRQVPPSPEWLPYNRTEFVSDVLPHKTLRFRAMAQRPKMVAWIVSKCSVSSQRMAYVEKLKRYIPVDIMGPCGKIPCDRSFLESRWVVDNCTRAVRQDYLFYLSFENAFCDDYITEKFFERVARSSLPVVRGKKSNYDRVAPPHSYINVHDYANPKALADYLHQLAADPTEYLSYFWWRDYYQVHKGTDADHARAMCRLCEKLNDPLEPPKVYHDMDAWWRQGHCQIPRGND